MKTLFLWLVSLFSSLSLLAQYNTVTINVQGNRNRQVSLDGVTYTIDELSSTTEKRNSIIINNLSTGQHKLEVVNNNPSTADDDNVSTTFRLRTGYDMVITVRNNGSIQTREVKASTAVTGHPGVSKTPMSSSNFNTLLQNIKRQSRLNTKYSLVANALATTNNYFTTSQVELMVLQISAQSSRLTLLKSSYLKVTDPENFSGLYSLLSSGSLQQDLIAHVNSYKYNTTTAGTRIPLSTTAFNSLYQAAQNQVSTNRVNYISDAFLNTANYFTAYQARQLILLVPDETNRLSLAKSAYRGITDPANFYYVSDLLSSTAARNDLASYVAAYSGTTTQTTRVPMSDANFSTLYTQIQSAWGLGAKYNMLTSTFANTSYYFTTAQAKQLIRLVTSESNRLTLAKAAYRTITDPANFSQLYDVLSSTASQNELDVYVKNNGGTGVYGTTTPTRVAMSDDNYNTLYRSVQNSWGLGAKMNALTNIFANTTYYFTTAQASKLIELVSSESNRLTLAKAAFKQIVDPENYAQLANIMTSQSGKEEIEVYARNNR